jgi:hypothetical protein
MCSSSFEWQDKETKVDVDVFLGDVPHQTDDICDKAHTLKYSYAMSW